MEKILAALFIGVGALVIAAALSLVTAFIGMLCWNLALVAVFPAIPEITFWQMFGVMVLSHLLFKTQVNVNSK